MDQTSSLVSGMLGRCPMCGRGRLYKGFLELETACSVCHADLSRPGSAEDPFAFIVLIVGMIVVGAALVVEIRYQWPIWLHLLVWLPLSLAMCLALLRPMRGLLVAIQLRHRSHEVDSV